MVFSYKIQISPPLSDKLQDSSPSDVLGERLVVILGKPDNRRSAHNVILGNESPVA
jgi:hypothetical protein